MPVCWWIVACFGPNGQPNLLLDLLLYQLPPRPRPQQDRSLRCPPRPIAFLPWRRGGRRGHPLNPMPQLLVVASIIFLVRISASSSPPPPSNNPRSPFVVHPVLLHHALKKAPVAAADALSAVNLSRGIKKMRNDANQNNSFQRSLQHRCDLT